MSNLALSSQNDSLDRAAATSDDLSCSIVDVDGLAMAMGGQIAPMASGYFFNSRLSQS
ncbi:hypothetical protein ACN4EG_15745 [Alkalinema pantanalense CENA528]|uniref:hypothetical protein n=1 Tax=Alkalinema pantanalense TaxID=1620705 RepID=UPI003D6F6A13